MKLKRSHRTHDVARTTRIETSTIPEMSREMIKEIEELAYLYWEERGCQGGSAEDDWIRAEVEVRKRRSAAEPKASSAHT